MSKVLALGWASNPASTEPPMYPMYAILVTIHRFSTGLHVPVAPVRKMAVLEAIASELLELLVRCVRLNVLESEWGIHAVQSRAFIARWEGGHGSIKTRFALSKRAGEPLASRRASLMIHTRSHRGLNAMVSR